MKGSSTGACAFIFQSTDANDRPGEHEGVITADSGGGMVDIHDRGPVVLRPALAQEWLNPALPMERAEHMVLYKG